jgi:hypothetical protein
VTNPQELFDPAGEGRTAGIEVAAHEVSISDCAVDRFGYGIVVAFDGEWLNTRIVGNRVSNVLGAGGGRRDGGRAGEDRGDGITVWGAQATVVGNVVSAKPGTDARIGIHAEGLGDVKRVATPHSEAMVTVSGNVVTGPFRRSIVFEEIANGIASNNTVADATWWGLALIGGRACTFTGNAVRYTRAAADDQGSAYSPTRCGVVVLGGEGHTVAENTITVQESADAFVAVLPLEGERSSDIRIAGNNCRTVGDGRCAAGIVLEGEPGPLRPKLQGNTVVGAEGEGLYLGAGQRVEVSGNTVVGGPGSTHGVLADHPRNAGTLLLGNRVSSYPIGIGLFGQDGAVVSANVVDDCDVAVDLFGSSGVTLTGNLLTGARTSVDHLGGNPVLP